MDQDTALTKPDGAQVEPDPWGPIGRLVFDRTYARPTATGRETWEQTVVRVVDGNLGLVGPSHVHAGERAQLIDLIGSFRILPAGRHLWTAGTGLPWNRNCHRAGWTTRLSEHFCFLFHELLKGGGVGANYSDEYLRRGPIIRGELGVTFACSVDHPDHGPWIGASPDRNDPDVVRVTVADTREGWVDAVELVCDAAERPGRHRFEIDVSLLRERGAPIRRAGGIASGPEPFVEMVRTIAAVLNGSRSRSLGWRDAMSIDHALATCVAAGNVNRSARMSVKHWADPDILEFVRCKSDPVAHWTTNISVEVDEEFFRQVHAGHGNATALLRTVATGMLANGEPGLFNATNAAIGERADVRCPNPCGEIALEEGEHGAGESCNLGHVNLAYFQDVSDLEIAFRLMTRFLLRATFATPTDPHQAVLEARNRRIGVGFLGFQEWLGARGVRWSEAVGDSDVRASLRGFRAIVRDEADGYADELCVPRPIKVTTVAPTGTIAKLPGVSEGMHPIHARFYRRRVRFSRDDLALRELEADGHELEPCLYAPECVVATFVVRDPIVDRIAEELIEEAGDLSVDLMLATQAMVQHEYCGGEDGNAVSFTANVAADLDVDDLVAALARWGPTLKGTTVFPARSRPQAPYEPISRDEYERLCGRLDLQTIVPIVECEGGGCPTR
jgi:ribonucleoside-triphosphate reductase (thioredoxin)